MERLYRFNPQNLLALKRYNYFKLLLLFEAIV
jgi:hypothetical protein